MCSAAAAERTIATSGRSARRGNGGSRSRRDAAPARTYRSWDRAQASRPRRSRSKPGYDTAAASIPVTSTPPVEASPATAPSIAIRWSPRESIVPPGSGVPSPRTANPSAVSSMSAPRPRRPSTTAAIRFDSLKRSSPAPRTTVSPSANAPSSATRVSSSIASGTSSGPTAVPSSGADATSSSPTGSSSASVPGSSRSPRITAPIRSAMRRKPVRVQLSATFPMTTREPGTSVAAATRKAALVALHDASLARRQQAGYEHARLDLGARHGQFVGDAPQLGTAHRERGQAGIARLDVGAHLAQRLRHPVHRPPPDRLVAVERPDASRLPREPARQQAHQRDGVAHVEQPAGRLERRAQADAAHEQGPAGLLVHGRADL